MSRNSRRFWPKWGIGIKINWCVATRIYTYFSRPYCEQPINQQGINCSRVHFDYHNRASILGHHNLSISLTRASWRSKPLKRNVVGRVVTFLPTRLTSRFIPEHEFRFAGITPFFGLFCRRWKVKTTLNQLFFVSSYFRKEYFVTLYRALRVFVTNSDPLTIGSARNCLIWSIKSVRDGLASRMRISTIISYLRTLHLGNSSTLCVHW